jgi:hypothetical protein
MLVLATLLRFTGQISFFEIGGAGLAAVLTVGVSSISALTVAEHRQLLPQRRIELYGRKDLQQPHHRPRARGACFAASGGLPFPNIVDAMQLSLAVAAPSPSPRRYRP